MRDGSMHIVSTETISAETLGVPVKAAVVKAWGEPPEYTDFAEPAPSDGTEVATVHGPAGCDAVNQMPALSA